MTPPTNKQVAAWEAEVFAGMDDEQRAEAMDVVERLSAAISDACAIWGTLYIASMLHRMGPKLIERPYRDEGQP
jgi:hypothetical protein